jgi:hypothetical protein
MSYTIKVLAITFVSTIVFNAIDFDSDGLIAINKPFGVPLMKNGLTTGHSESLFSIDEALHDSAGIQIQCRKNLASQIDSEIFKWNFLIHQPGESG